MLANIEVIPARFEQKPMVANLLELYSYDFSEIIKLDLGPDGRFGYKYLPLYWEESNRLPFIVKVDGHIAGFVLIRRGSGILGSQDVWDMAEFFIMRGYRNRGIGMKVAHEIWGRYAGRWEIRVIEINEKAIKFWQTAVADFVGEDVAPVAVDSDGKRWIVFSFEY